MTREIGRKALDMFLYLAEGAKSLEITFTGGEPVLEFSLMGELTGFARERAQDAGMEVSFILKTNGTILTPAIMDYMRERCSRVVISIDGTPTSHDECRRTAGGKGTYDVVSRNLLALQHDGVRCVASVTVHPRLCKMVLANVRHLHELGVSQIDLGPAYGTVAWNQIDGCAFAQSLEDVALYMRQVNGSGARLEVGPLYHESEHVGGMLSDRWGCHAASTNLAFLPNGQITGCSALAMLTSTFPDLILGDVSGGLNDEAVARLLQVAQTGREERPACRECEAAANCTGGCLAINYSTSGVALTPPSFYCQTISMIPKAWHRAWVEQVPSVTARENGSRRSLTGSV